MDQYFTKAEELLDGIYACLYNTTETTDTVKLDDLKILEPSAGKGDIILNCFDEKLYKNITLCEIDKALTDELGSTCNGCDIINDDFLKHEFKTKYDIIVGNPPFTFTNEFINKCFQLLNDNGWLIFIVPDNTLKLTSNVQLLQQMDHAGIFHRIIKYTNERLFENANVPVMIFSYHKTKTNDRKCLYSVDNEKPVEIEYVINPIFTFKQSISSVMIKDLFSVHVGYVSGADKILKTNSPPLVDTNNTISILKKENVIETYYDFDNEEEALSVIGKYKEQLMNRKIKRFNENNWFEFGLKRNENVVVDNFDKPCLYVYNQTRNQRICFIGTVQYFGGNLLLLLPKNNEINLEKVCDYINNSNWKNQYISDNNRFRISHKQLETTFIEY